MSDVKKRRGRGRPRAFDHATVLERAMQVFWTMGYDAATIPSLTQAMGISAQSLYAAFGSKEALYREAIGHYTATIGGFAARALEQERDALDAVTRLLRDAAATFSRTAGAPGCMIATPYANMNNAELSAIGRDLRAAGERTVAERLERGVSEGQLCANTDCAAWARYVATVVQGLSVQAVDGSSFAELQSTVGIATSTLKRLRA